LADDGAGDAVLLDELALDRQSVAGRNSPPLMRAARATKTDAGERVVPLVVALRERIVEHRMNCPTGPAEPAFPTRNGTAQRPDNVRSRMLAPVRARANELLAKDGRLPIAHMPPHTLRRTFASVLAATNVPPPRAMYLLGHTDAKLTLSVYQQVLDVGAGSIEVLEGILGCSLQEACDVLTGRVFVASSYPEPAVGERPARGPGP
jgi:integrase